MKLRPGENRELLGRIFKLADPVKQEAAQKKYDEFLLRQRITLKDNVKDVFGFERDKNNLVFGLFDAEKQRLLQQSMDQNEQLNQDNNTLVTLTREKDRLETEISVWEDKQARSMALMDRRRRVLKERGKEAELRHIAILKNAAKGLEPSIVSESGGIQRTREPSRIFLPGEMPEDLDQFEQDEVYMAYKVRYGETAKLIRGRDIVSAENEKQIRILNSEILELKRSVVRLEAMQKQGKEREKKVRKLRLEFVTLVLKAGIDSRDDGCVWLLRESKKLGGEVREEMLPDFVDSDSREFIMTKFVAYQAIMDLKDRNDFSLRFYKLLTGGEGSMDKVMELVKARARKVERNPMLELFEETDCIAIKGQRLRTSSPDPRDISPIHAQHNHRSDMFLGLDLDTPFLTHTNEVFSSHRTPKPEIIHERHIIEPLSATMESLEHYFIPRYLLPMKYRVAYLPIFSDPQPTNIATPEPSKPRRLPSIEEQSCLDNLDEKRLQKTEWSRSLLVPASAQLSSHAAQDHPGNRSSYLQNSALASVVTTKQEEFSRAGVIFIGDPNYKFSYLRNFEADTLLQHEAFQVSNELVSKAVAAYRAQTHIPVLASEHPSEDESAKEESLVESEEEDSLDDPFATHVHFYDGEILLNGPKSRMVYVGVYLETDERIFRFSRHQRG